MSRIANKCPKGFWDSHFVGIKGKDCTGMYYTVLCLIHQCYYSPSHYTTRHMGLHGTSHNVPYMSTSHFLLSIPIPLYQLTDTWDCIGHPGMFHSVPYMSTYCPSHPTVPTDTWDCMGCPTLSHACTCLPLNPYCPSHPTVVPTDTRDCMGHPTLSH